MVADLKLTDKQVAEISRIYEDFERESLKPLSMKIRSKRRQVNTLLRQEKTDQKAFDRAVDELLKLRDRLLRASLEMKLKVKKVLTKEQIRTLRKRYPGLLSIGSRWSKGRAFTGSVEKKTVKEKEEKKGGGEKKGAGSGRQ